LLELFYDGVGTGFRVLDPSGGTVLTLPVAGSGIFPPETCMVRARPGQYIATWVGVSAALAERFRSEWSSYRVEIATLGGDKVTLPLGDSGCHIVAPSSTPIPMPSFVDISAPSANVVWALVAVTHLFRSTDRGTTWQERPLPSDAVSGQVAALSRPEVSFISEREGWLLDPDSPAGNCDTQSLRLWRTTDAGATWTRVAASQLATADGKCRQSLSFVDQQRGFVAGYEPNKASVIYRTTDGGTIWSASQPLPAAASSCASPGGPCQAGSVRAFGNALLVDVTGYAGGRIRRSVFGSTDGGSSWSSLADVPDAEGAFAIVSASRWVQISIGSRSQETTDGGRSWHPYSSDYEQAAPVPPAITFADDRVGYATVRGGIQRTTDGGAHWEHFGPTPGTQ